MKRVDGGVVVTLLTVTETLLEVVVLLDVSLATAVRVYVPFAEVVVFHITENGDVVSSPPRFTPFSLNWTPETPTLSEAEAETVTVPATVPVGEERETVGGVVSEGGGGGGVVPLGYAPVGITTPGYSGPAYAPTSPPVDDIVFAICPDGIVKFALALSVNGVLVRTRLFASRLVAPCQPLKVLCSTPLYPQVRVDPFL